MMNITLETKIIEDIHLSYKDIHHPTYWFMKQKESNYDSLLVSLKSLYPHMIDDTDLNYDVAKCIYIQDAILYLSFVGQYACIIQNNTVIDKQAIMNKELLNLLEQHHITLLTKDDLFHVLPMKIPLYGNIDYSTVLHILFSSEPAISLSK